MPRALEILGLQGNGLHGTGTKANALGVESAVSPLSHCGADTGM